jgi:L-threonylcarbamoyladenylate synthase
MQPIIVDIINHKVLEKAKKVLLENGVIILPTDTNYNIVCDAQSKIAVNKIFDIKGREKHKLLSLFFSEPEDWRKYGASENEYAVQKVINKFWPGPLNIILNKTANVPNYIANNGNTVALGCISDSVWRSVVSYFGRPVALTSANKSGEKIENLVTKDVAYQQLGEAVDMFFIGNEKKQTTRSSTIIDFTGETFSIVRIGDITKEEIEKVICE